eukprot:210416_1
MPMHADTVHFDTCHLDQLFEISSMSSSSSIATLESEYCTQTISFIIASIIGLFSMSYGVLSRYLAKLRGFQFHFVGIGRPKRCQKSQYKLFENINTEHTMITIRSSLHGDDTILRLKEFIKRTYSISNDNDILILYSHHIVSHDEERTLNQVGITHNSLLTLAICDKEKGTASPQLEQHILAPPVAEDEAIETEAKMQEINQVMEEYDSESESESAFHGNEINAMFDMYSDYESETEPVESVNELFGMFTGDNDSDDDTDTEVESENPAPPTWPRLGFDIISQQHDVMVHKMPKCGHEMNAQSLYEYALNTFRDSSNMHLTCPHNKAYPESNALCETKWDYSLITDILQYVEDDETKPNKQEKEDKWMDYAKLELLSSRNVIEDQCNVQKCPQCQTLYYKSYDEEAKQLQDIKTMEDIENEFKFKCVLCPELIVEIKPPPAIVTEVKNSSVNRTNRHFEDDIEEDIDAHAVNLMFGMDDDEEEDESDVEEDDNIDALITISHMFDDDGIVSGDEDDEEEDVVECKTICKPFEFCFCCGKEWEPEHICNSSFILDLVEILSVAEVKKIGPVDDVPSIRCCPKCCQLIFHVDACKHMQCRECKTNFCFVCLKEYQNGAWQCGSHSDKCPAADRQNKDTLPDTIVITKRSFKLF